MEAELPASSEQSRWWQARYLRVGLAFAGLALGSWLALTSHSRLAGLVWSAVAVLSLIEPIRNMITRAKSGDLGLDILAVMAVTAALLTGEYLAASVIACMLTGGEALEAFAENRAKRNLSLLLRQAPKLAHRLRDEQVGDCPVDALGPGDLIMIEPGEVVPADCRITIGSSSFDQAAITGESIPVEHAVGDELYSGVINAADLIQARVLRRGADSQYQRIVDLVSGSAASRSPLERLASRSRFPFTVVALMIAAGAWIVTGESSRMLAVLVVATPCPLLLATPVAIISGMNRASANGILLKNAESLERLASLHALAFDKTGTLTAGRPTITRIITSGASENEVLRVAASVEQSSGHVLARAITTEARARDLQLMSVGSSHDTPGQGLEAVVDGQTVLVGSKRFLESHKVRWSATVTNYQGNGETLIYVARAGRCLGLIACADTVRPEASATLHALRRLGIHQTIMLTGDLEPIAKAIASQLQLRTVRAELMPEGKVEAMRQLGSNWRPIGMVGDGINDAPTLAAADLGIAMAGDQPTAASESADMVILHQDLGRLSLAITIARRTLKIARQSIYVGIGLSLSLMLIAATGHLRPVYGALLQELVDVAVIFNALRASLPERTIKA